MKKILSVILLTSSLLNSQNKEVIKEAFYKQPINNIDKIALKNGFRGNETLCISVVIKTDSIGGVFDVKVDEKFKIFEAEINSFVKQIPTLNPNEYLNKGKVMKYGVEMCLKLATNKERKKILKEGEKIKIRFKRFYIKEYFPVKIIEIEEVEKNEFSKIESIPITQNCKNLTDNDEIKICVMNDIKNYINRKFDVGLASELGLPSGKQKVIITFYIAKNGEIVNITAKGSVKELREEGIRVINTFPNFYKGGTIDGKPVDVKYTIPISLLIG
jgi:hypothetical protein